MLQASFADNTNNSKSIVPTLRTEPINMSVRQHKLGGKERFTNREKDVFKQLLRGTTAKQIAKELGISWRTVEQHINQIKSKLGCRYKNEIILTAIRNNLIAID